MVEADATGLLLSGFGLTTMARQLEDIEERAQAGGWSFRRTLRELLETEAAERGQRRLLRLLKDSGLPEGKTLAALEENRLSAATRRQLAELCEGHFVERAVNVLAFGLPGRGKTHFLSAVGYELIQRHSQRVLFIPSFKLIQRLLEAKRELKLEVLLKKLDGYAAIILDDLGYVQQTREEMEVLFTFLAERYERRSVMISSNLVFSKWERIFQDPMTAMAAVDRLVHHSVILEFGGESQRGPKNQKAAKPTG
ncbi:MAG: IS21-like element helper ATPase IstB [Terrimicrobiaceae bacterium]